MIHSITVSGQNAATGGACEVQIAVNTDNGAAWVLIMDDGGTRHCALSPLELQRLLALAGTPEFERSLERASAAAPSASRIDVRLSIETGVR